MCVCETERERERGGERERERERMLDRFARALSSSPTKNHNSE